VILDVRPDGSVEFMTRSTNGGATAYLAGAVQSFPAWLMLARTGTTVTGSVSTDGGNTWTAVGSVGATGISSTAQIGLVVTSHDTSMLDTSTFNSVAVTVPATRTPPGAPTAPGPTSGATGVATTPTLTWSASGATSYDVRFGTASSPPLVSSGQSGATYSPGGLAGGTKYFWQIVARNAAGTTSGAVWSFTTTTTTSGPANVVIYASDIPASARHGSWSAATDPTSPNGTKLVTPDNGVAQTTSALASPTDYVDVTFAAQAGTYTLWMRLQAAANSKFNDSIWVQFSDASVSGSSVYPLNTTAALLVNLATDGTGSSLSGWGWINSAYWLSQPTTVTFAASGTHTLRVQVREDGIQFDQIVLSPTTYLNAPPGPTANDSTIVPKS
jgi:hypothetical protein